MCVFMHMRICMCVGIGMCMCVFVYVYVCLYSKQALIVLVVLLCVFVCTWFAFINNATSSMVKHHYTMQHRVDMFP